MNRQQLTRRVRREVIEMIGSSRLAAANDRRIIANARAVPAGAGGAHVLIASAGAGNVGDQAMFESFLAAVAGDVVVLARDATDFIVPGRFADRVRVLVLTDLIYGSRAARAADLRRFAELLSTAGSLSIIGADVMDGKYSPRASVRRATLAEAAAAAGVPTRILGFSWNPQPHRRALGALRRASRAGVIPLLRDPISAARARSDGLSGVRDCADIVFTASGADAGAADRLLSDDRTLAIVNASALVGRGFDQVPEYQRIVENLLADGFRVVLLPHVSRPNSDDIAACAAVFRAVLESRADAAAGDLVLVEELLTPAAIRGLTGRAALVVTGRMHLAIMSLLNAVPAVTVTTQGKVEGLMDLFGTPELCIEPRSGMAAEIIAVIQALGAERTVHNKLRNALPTVISLAGENFRGIELPSAASAVDTTKIPEPAQGPTHIETVRNG